MEFTIISHFLSLGTIKLYLKMNPPNYENFLLFDLFFSCFRLDCFQLISLLNFSLEIVSETLIISFPASFKHDIDNVINDYFYFVSNSRQCVCKRNPISFQYSDGAWSKITNPIQYLSSSSIFRLSLEKSEIEPNRK